MLTHLWHIELLSGLRAYQDERQVIRFRTQKAGALLAYLAYRVGQHFTREMLVTMLWPECEPPAGHHNLRMALLSIRRQLEPPGVVPGSVIMANRETIGLAAQGATTDVAEFDEALVAARATISAAERQRHLRRAVLLYKGHLLPGCYEDWVQPERERLSEAVQQVLQTLFVARRHAGDIAGALEFSRRAVVLDPLCERAHREVMRLCALAGRPDAAVRQYHELERLLARELGVRPERATQELIDAIRRDRCDAAKAMRVPEVERTTGESDAAVKHGTSGAVPDAVSARPPVVGTVTFLLMEIGTRRNRSALDVWKAYRARIRPVVARYAGGECGFETSGSCASAFGRAHDALECAIVCQAEAQRLAADRQVGFSVTMVLHTGDVDETVSGGVQGATSVWTGAGDVLRVAEGILGAAHPGQILCSDATAALVCRSPGAAHVTDLGTFRLSGVDGRERLFQVGHPSMVPGPFPAPKALPDCPANLPIPGTRFFGREDEIARLCSALLSPGSRLVSITGPGGSGKTHLGLQACASRVVRGEAVVFFVRLADVAGPEGICSAVADALQLAPATEEALLDELAHRLADQPAVFILDGCEHLIPGGLPVISRLVSSVHGLRCVVTSRRRLGLDGERVIAIAGLPTPEAESDPESVSRYPSVQLFVDRGQAVRPDFQVTKANAGTISVLCRRLDGMPLSIELLAARVQGISLHQMQDDLAGHLDWQADRRYAGHSRHTSLRETIDWSYRLLSPQRRRIFVLLSVLQGSWSLGDAVGVCSHLSAGEVLEELMQLHADSLVLVEEGPSGLRFRMQESIRQFARECLGRGGDVEGARRPPPARPPCPPLTSWQR